MSYRQIYRQSTTGEALFWDGERWFPTWDFNIYRKAARSLVGLSYGMIAEADMDVFDSLLGETETP